MTFLYIYDIQMHGSSHGQVDGFTLIYSKGHNQQAQ